MDILDEIYSENDITIIKKPSKRVRINSPRINSNGKNLFEVSENLTNNVKLKNNIMENKPEYLSQFDAQTFDSKGLPSAMNDIYETNDKSKLANIERDFSFQEGWTKYHQDNSMTYGIIPDDQLTHNNMVPSFSMKHGYGSNDIHNQAVMNYKNELFTGNFKDRKKKQESRPMFNPVANLTHPYGTPIAKEDEKDRYHVSMYRQGETPFESVKNTPGLGLGYNEDRSMGCYVPYRVMEKNVDELRGSARPKITYEGRIIEGRKGHNRPIQAEVIKYRPDTFKTMTEDDMLPTSGINTAPKIRENFIMKDTDRAKQHFEYTGGAFAVDQVVGKNVPEHMREKYKESTKQTFKMPKPLLKFSRVESQYNPNIQSYHLPETMKHINVNNDRTGLVQQPNGIYSNMMDVAKSTLKEQTAEMPSIHTNVAPNTMRGTIHPMDIAKETIKEITIESRLNPHVTPSNNQQRIYNSDIAKSTLKEIMLEPVVPMNAGLDTNLYSNWMDISRPTIKETTIDIPYQTMITPVNQSQRASNHTDLARSTVKETTVNIPCQTMVTPVNQFQRTPNHTDLARSTIKETTVDIPYQTMITPVNQSQCAPNHTDLARSTIKETTVDIPYQTMVTPVNQSQRPVGPQDVMRTTTKESTVDIPRHIQFATVNRSQGAVPYMDIAKSTIKETTVQTPWNSFISPVNQYIRAANPSDIARQTIKETTVDKPWNTNITPVNQSIRAANPSDIARQTIKETTVDKARSSFITPVNQSVRAANPSDIARQTIKETTVDKPWNSFITPVNQSVRAANPSDIARQTIKETTVDKPWNSFVTPVNQSVRAVNPSDIAKQTIKETTVDKPWNSFITPVNQSVRAANPSDIARQTIKETTIDIPYNTHLTGNFQGQANTFNRIPLRTTMKEQIVQIPHNTVIGNQTGQKGKTHLQDSARTTLKEQLIQIPYNTIATAVGQQQRAPNHSDVAKTTIKEQTVQIPYNTHIMSVNQTKGQADTHNRTPLDPTIKETTIDTKYIGGTNMNTFGKGLGYIAEKMFAPNTNKQFTCQEVYVTPLSGNAINRPYDAEYRSRSTDDRKEKLHWYRTPTNCGVTLGPDPLNINVRKRSDITPGREPMMGNSTEFTDRMLPILSAKPDFNDTSNRFMDPILLAQLKSNPYNLSINV